MVDILLFVDDVIINMLPLLVSTRTSAEYEMWSKGRRVEWRMQRHNENVCSSPNIMESHPQPDRRDM
jgi:hypothetical protein